MKSFSLTLLFLKVRTNRPTNVGNMLTECWQHICWIQLLDDDRRIFKEWNKPCSFRNFVRLTKPHFKGIFCLETPKICKKYELSSDYSAPRVDNTIERTHEAIQATVNQFISLT